MAARHEFSTAGIVAFCDDLREHAPKQTALAVRYFLEIASAPRKSASYYHQAIMGEQNYSHGNTIIRGLASLHYLKITRAQKDGAADLIEITPAWKERLAARNSNDNARERSPMEIQMAVDEAERQVHLISPYHPDMPALAKEAGGKWNSEAWVFPLDREEEVRSICLRIYGEDGTPQPRVTLRCRASEQLIGRAPAKSIFLAGRQIASTKGADSGVLLGESIAILEGSFARQKKEKGAVIVVNPGTVFEIRDLPKLAADRLLAAHPDDVEAINESAPATRAAEGEGMSPDAHNVPAATPEDLSETGLVPILRQSLQEAREDIMRLCEAHGLEWPEIGLAKYQRVIDKARVIELTSHDK